MDSILVEFLYRHSAGSESLRTLAQVVAVFSIFVLAALAMGAALRTPLQLRSRLVVALSALGGIAVALGVNVMVHLAYSRPRPFVSMSVPPLAPHARDPSFFSDHLAVAGGLVVMIYILDRRLWWSALALSGLTAAGRMAAALHYPSDLLVGFALGAVSVTLFWLYARTRFLSPEDSGTVGLDQSVVRKKRG